MSHDHAHPTIQNKPMSRRTMMKALAASSVAVGAGSALLGGTAASAAPPSGVPGSAAGHGGQRLVPTNRIGIQMFTVRDKVASEGFRAVFEELGSIGYSEIEFAGYNQGTGDISIAEIRALLDDNGLGAVGSHVNLTPDNIDAEIEKALALGMPYLGQGGPITRGTTKAEWQQAAQTWGAMGEKARAAGLGLYIHNHSGEFAFTSDDPSTRVYDLLWDELAGTNVTFELDVYWAYVGQYRYPGFEPEDYVLADPSRFRLLHLKDGKINEESDNGYDIIEFGAGDLPYQRFLSAIKPMRGRRYGMYEQDNAASVAEPGYELNSLGNAARSYEAISTLRGKRGNER
ncbi:sugar phosphate isomerase/epimerase family protein [Microbacterium halophytorum]|uniref:sugar phosphate isomerase/epimerase family protein n=1 Tax=Microbacterium halophytorum TaxID=2067568 RepID=UPI0018E06D2D|nr:sugar phosphate isomerase/epimerase [Microbacterium halophytorum]